MDSNSIWHPALSFDLSGLVRLALFWISASSQGGEMQAGRLSELIQVQKQSAFWNWDSYFNLQPLLLELLFLPVSWRFLESSHSLTFMNLPGKKQGQFKVQDVSHAFLCLVGWDWVTKQKVSGGQEARCGSTPWLTVTEWGELPRLPAEMATGTVIQQGDYEDVALRQNTS